MVPLGIIGVVAALLVSGNRPLGFVAILGILALIGMIAKNAVILIDQIESERAAGKTVWDAVVEASASRFRPIMLAALSTVLGMIPIAPTVFWGSDGLRHHGRPAGGVAADAGVSTNALCHMV
jgi:multidrug efflux pump subunit AcrB